MTRPIESAFGVTRRTGGAARFFRIGRATAPHLPYAESTRRPIRSSDSASDSELGLGVRPLITFPWGAVLSARFIAGVGVGVAMAAVTLVTVEAARRIRSCRRRMAEPGHIIDGVRPPTRAELAVRPAEEANAPEPPRLESEAPDISPLNERW